MYSLLFLACELVSHLLPFLAVLLLRKGKQTAPTRLQYAAAILFALYVTAVFHVTGAGTLYDGIRNLPYGLFNRINPFPFYNPIDLIAYALNIVMFVPFGFLIPVLCPENRKLSRIALSGLLFSVLIEVSQILSLRGTDVDDLIMNTLGALAGYLIYKLWAHRKAPASGFSALEPALWILAIFFGRFLLFDYTGLIRLVYGF